jgi:hypothetical protein
MLKKFINVQVIVSGIIALAVYDLFVTGLIKKVSPNAYDNTYDGPETGKLVREDATHKYFTVGGKLYRVSNGNGMHSNRGVSA